MDPSVNPAYCALTDYERDEPLSMNIADLTHPADQAADREHAVLIRRGQAPVKKLEKSYIRKDGTAVWVNLTVSTVQLLGEEPHVFGVAVYTTVHKKAEHAFRERERHFCQLSEGLPSRPDGLPDGFCECLSPQWVRYTRIPEAEQL